MKLFTLTDIEHNFQIIYCKIFLYYNEFVLFVYKNILIILELN